MKKAYTEIEYLKFRIEDLIEENSKLMDQIDRNYTTINKLKEDNKKLEIEINEIKNLYGE